MGRNATHLKPVFRRSRPLTWILSWYVSLLPIGASAQPPDGDVLRAIPTIAAVVTQPGNARTGTKPLFGDIQAGPLTITLEVTTLSAVQQAFGGTIRHRGDAGDSAYWLCYTAVGVQTEADASANADASRVVLFVSDGEMGGAAHTLSTVAFEPRVRPHLPDADARHHVHTASEATDDCPNAPMVLQHLDFGIPSVGAQALAVEDLFGRADADRRGNRVYSSEYKRPGLPDATTLQTAQYTVRAGHVTGIAVTQVTTN